LLLAQHDSIPAGVYQLKTPATLQDKIMSTILFEGSTTDMEYLQMSACSISGGKTNDFRTPDNEERLLIIRSGVVVVHVNDSSFTLTKGSIALIMPRDHYSLLGKHKSARSDFAKPTSDTSAGDQPSDACDYYLMKYRSKNPLGKAAGGSFVKKWEYIPFRPHDKGGVRNFFQHPTAMTRRFEMHATTLNEGLRSHDPHRHRAEEIIVVIDGKAEEQIGEKFYNASAGDVIFLPSNVSHAIRNDGTGPCTYFAFQFE